MMNHECRFNFKKVIKINVGIFLGGIKKKISKSRKFLPNLLKFPFFSFFSVLKQKKKREEWTLVNMA